MGGKCQGRQVTNYVFIALAGYARSSGGLMSSSLPNICAPAIPAAGVLDDTRRPSIRLPSELGIGIKLKRVATRLTQANPGSVFRNAKASTRFTAGPANDTHRLAHLGPASRTVYNPIHESPTFLIFTPQNNATAM